MTELVGSWSRGSPRARVRQRLRLVVVAALAGLCANAVAPTSVPAPTALIAARTTVAGAGGPAHAKAFPVAQDHGGLPYLAPQALDPATARQLAGELVRARAAALRYPTVADAERAGFTEATGFVPFVGAHFMKYSEISGIFDVDHPAMILYDGDLPGSRVSGLAYYVISGARPPDGFAGPNDRWHQHPGVCVTANGPVLAGDAPETCRLGGRPAWMLHAWVVPAYPSPQGAFSAENISIRPPTSGLINVYRCQL